MDQWIFSLECLGGPCERLYIMYRAMNEELENNCIIPGPMNVFLCSAGDRDGGKEGLCIMYQPINVFLCSAGGRARKGLCHLHGPTAWLPALSVSSPRDVQRLRQVSPQPPWRLSDLPKGNLWNHSRLPFIKMCLGWRLPFIKMCLGCRHFSWKFINIYFIIIVDLYVFFQ